MKRMNTELKVGLFALLVLSVFAYMTFKAGGIEFTTKKGYVVYVYFKNIAGLDEKTKVKISGVNAGVIEKIQLDEGRAKLTVRMNREVKLYSDASASIKAAGLLGDKYLEIKPGLEDPVLVDGESLKNVSEIVDLDDLTRNLTAVSENINILAKALNETFAPAETKQALKESIINLRDITAQFKETIEVNDAKLRATLDTIHSLALSINDLVKDNRESVTAAISNMENFSASLKTEGPELVANLSKAAEELKGLVEENRPAIKRTTESLDQIAQKIDSGEGSLGKLIKDDSLHESIKNAAQGIERTVSAIDRFRTFISFQADYLTGSEDAKGYFTVTLQPRPERYYILGVVSDPIGRVEKTVTIRKTDEGKKRIEKKEIKDEIEFTAHYAMRHSDFALRLGFTENTFGAGTDYFFNNDRGKISADIWDFDNDEEHSNNPHLRIGIDYFLFRNLFITAGGDNLLNDEWRGAYAGVGLRIEDEDFKYLFGSLPRISP